ncbi:MAG: MarR family transcriptional regulator [Cocleimonas sp.]|nr:MarR family transcriptional regulator [Cocleimonas sp.]
MKVDLNQYLCFNLYRGWREISSFYKDILGKDISLQNVYILDLCDLHEKITMNDLSEAMHLDGSAVSTLVSRMEKKSLLERTHSKEDRRFVYVQLTQQGQEFKDKLKTKSALLTKNIKKNISVGDIEQLQEIVNQIATNRADFKDSV